ncbi:hypothetical protein INR49_023129 [Caranx melampygus]|nr:hypothetical protein INR49_023129 [Caranx melampygus]
MLGYETNQQRGAKQATAADSHHKDRPIHLLLQVPPGASDAAALEELPEVIRGSRRRDDYSSRPASCHSHSGSARQLHETRGILCQI